MHQISYQKTWCLDLALLAINALDNKSTVPSKQIGQASSSSVIDSLDSVNFETSDFFGESSKELDCVLQSDSSRSSHVGRVSKLSVKTTPTDSFSETLNHLTVNIPRPHHMAKVLEVA